MDGRRDRRPRGADGAQDALVGSLERAREVGARLQRVAAASLTINASQSLTSIAGVLAGEARTLIPCHQAFGSVASTRTGRTP